MWGDLVYACGNQRIFCSEDCVAILTHRVRAPARLSDGPADLVAARGRLVRGGRFERGYVRREPRPAADYLRSVASGRFWGFTSG